MLPGPLVIARRHGSTRPEGAKKARPGRHRSPALNRQARNHPVEQIAEGFSALAPEHRAALGGDEDFAFALEVAKLHQDRAICALDRLRRDSEFIVLVEPDGRKPEGPG